MGKANLDNPWADVFEVKEWKTERDKTGQKGSLTDKVSVTDSFAKFNKASDKAAAAPILIKQLELYETVLKSKHSKEKFFSALQKLVQSQIKAVEEGVKLADEAEKAGHIAKQGEGLSLEKFIEKRGPAAEQWQKQAIVEIKKLSQLFGDGKGDEGKTLMVKVYGTVNGILNAVEDIRKFPEKEKIKDVGNKLVSWDKIADQGKKALATLKDVDKVLDAAVKAQKFDLVKATLVPKVDEILKIVEGIKVP
jgi:hypothetical protein